MQVGQFGGIVDELEGLKRDKNVLMVELVRLRQQQQVGFDVLVHESRASESNH